MELTLQKYPNIIVARTRKTQVLSCMIDTIMGESVTIKNYIENANFEDTGFSYTLSLIQGKHKMVILYCLMEYEVIEE